MANENKEGSQQLDRWEERHVRLLINCWKSNKELFGNGKTTKKEIFTKVADAFNAQSELHVSGEQCSRKWNKLTAKHKEVSDHNNKSGNNRQTWKFQTEMEECIGTNASVKPIFTLESSSDTQNEKLEEEESDSSDDENETKKKTPKKRAKKRKSKSSAAEMLKDFLKDYQTQKEETENKKIKILQEMNEEKKEFWNSFLDVMKSSKKR